MESLVKVRSPARILLLSNLEQQNTGPLSRAINIKLGMRDPLRPEAHVCWQSLGSYSSSNFEIHSCVANIKPLS
jgi:hypothetical protein